MAKHIIVSNRLPIKISKVNNSFKFIPTSGGLATGMNSIHKNKNSLWIGWPGISRDEIDSLSFDKMNKKLYESGFCPVHLSSKDIKDFYYGLPNNCLWPLFHYFIEYSLFDNLQWEKYKEINKKFSDCVLSNLEKDDTVWIHDYQLMLCPKMIKDERPDVKIGFFLHIPFPSFEIFRTFPRRKELLEGILGSDVIGFHTYDYQRHFLSSVKRILKLDVDFNNVIYNDRKILVNTFPMGIDFKKFNNAAINHRKQKTSEKSELRKQLELHKKGSNESKLILSIDRLDYTKGVINRIKAFEIFLEKYPSYCEKVRLIMLMVPSRSDVPEYKKLKKQTDELVGRINGKFATVNWTPIWYYYRAMDFHDLIDLYMLSDIAMISPLRDGMNLVAKEYVSTRINNDGVLILSEMAGASKELYEALLVNPYDLDSMADTLNKALNMSLKEQVKRNLGMQKRIKTYNVKFWAQEFIDALENNPNPKEKFSAIKIDENISDKILKEVKTSKKKLVLLDYDGTLVEFNENPELAVIDDELKKTIYTIINQKNTQLAIISGRDQEFLEKNFDNKKIILAAEHGQYMKFKQKKWVKISPLNRKWINNLKPVFESFTNRTPGTFIEIKKSSIAWHYRITDPELAAGRVVELNTVLSSMISDDLIIINANNVIEVTPSAINKGTTVSEILSKGKYDLIISIGDDVTDENMFKYLPKNSITIKVGKKTTKAKYYVDNVKNVRSLLNKFFS